MGDAAKGRLVDHPSQPCPSLLGHGGVSPSMGTRVVLREIDPSQLGQGLHTLIGGDITDLCHNPSPGDRTYPLDEEKVYTLLQGQELLSQLGFDLFDLVTQQLDELQNHSQLQSQGPVLGWGADALLGKSMELSQLPEFQPSTPYASRTRETNSSSLFSLIV